MRITPVPVAAMAPLADSRRDRASARPEPLADLGPRLPVAIADRLAGLLAQDPGLAEAVSARLPAARADSARDLAAYAPPAPTSTIDIRS
jgi:hypothetical protein